jgi:ribosome-associated protein
MQISDLLKYCRFETSRSSGPGGQNVNKTESKVAIYFSIDASDLSEEQKQLLKEKYTNKINSDGELYLQSMASRSQLENKEAVKLKLESLIQSALVPRKKRKKTKPSKASIEKRLESKKRVAEKKKWRNI